MSVITFAFLGNAQFVSIRGPKIKQLSTIFHFYIVSRLDGSVLECSAWVPYSNGEFVLLSIFSDLSPAEGGKPPQTLAHPLIKVKSNQA